MMKRTLTSMGVGMLIGAGLVYFIVRSQLSHMKPGLTPGVVAEQKWCDPGHTVPYIAASQCGGGSSCDRAQFLPQPEDRERINWPALCRKFVSQ
jgi:hypothetical protein